MKRLFELFQPPAGRARAWCALPLLALTLMVATADWWHVQVHKDAAAAHHDCAVMHWKGGELGFAEVAVSVPLPYLALAISLTPQPAQAPISADFPPTAARGPPLV